MQRQTTTFISVHQERQDCAAASEVEKIRPFRALAFYPRLSLKPDHDLLMKTAAHPDQSMSHDFLEPVGIGVTEAAKKLGGGHK